jgi:hypothetical protein
MAITDRTLRSSVFETIYDLLKAKATSGDYSTTQPTVVASFVDDYDFSAPLLVLSPLSVETSNNVFDRTNSTKEIVLLIEIYTKSNRDRDLLSDDVNYFMSQKITGLMLNNVSEDSSTIIINNSKVRYKSITFTFMRR